MCPAFFVFSEFNPKIGIIKIDRKILKKINLGKSHKFKYKKGRGSHMGKNVAIFLICFAIAFGGGYLFFKNDQTTQIDNEQIDTDQAAKDEAIDLQQGDASDNEGRIFVQRGCISCHSVSALNTQGGATGPDLSQAYVNVEGKHGLPIEEYLKNPTSAVMASVLGENPLTEDELKAVVEALKAASEK